MRADLIPDLLNSNTRPKVVVEILGGRAFRLRVVRPLRPFIMDKACALSPTSDHPLNRIHLPIEWRSWLQIVMLDTHNAVEFMSSYNRYSVDQRV